LRSANNWRRSAIALSVLLLAISLVDTYFLTKCVLGLQLNLFGCLLNSCHNEPVARGLLGTGSSEASCWGYPSGLVLATASLDQFKRRGR